MAERDDESPTTGRTEMTKLTATQQKALAVVAERGALYLGNEQGITFSTVRRLAELGLVRLETSIAWTSPALSVTPSRSYRDWAAYPVA